MSGAVLDGLQAELIASGVDVGEMEEAPAEELPETVEAEAAVEAEVIPAAEAEAAQPSA